MPRSSSSAKPPAIAARASAGSRSRPSVSSPVRASPRRARRSSIASSRASGSRKPSRSEAAGYRGARVSGIPFTSERQLTGAGLAEASATIVHRVLARLGIEETVLLWNVVPTHPGTERSNRRPTRTEVEAARPFLDDVLRNRISIAVGRVAAEALDAPYLRHPSHGGAADFEAGLQRAFATIRRRRAGVRRFS